MNLQVLSDIAGLCAAHSVSHVILCPGSRSAPLVLAFTRNHNLTCWTFSDERSAAFVALGMAQQMKRPVLLVCTSGSAAYNFSPAVAEAFFQNIPLIVFSADRPKEWIDQLDGQTIRQTELFGKHVKKFYELPQEYSTPDAVWHANRIVNEAINLATTAPCGPVHINAPFREPLYPQGNEKPITVGDFRKIEKVESHLSPTKEVWSKLAEKLSSFKKILIVPGQDDHKPQLIESLMQFDQTYHWPVAGDILSNLHALPNFIRHADTIVAHTSEIVKESLRPDLVITFGKSIVAKNLKLFLRKFSPREHWHLQPAGESADTFQSLTKVIAISPEAFFNGLVQRPFQKDNTAAGFQSEWLKHEERASRSIEEFFESQKDGEFSLVHKILGALPSRCNLHLANSMSVRYANHIGLNKNQKDVTVLSNRGTSGIDGCSSTAVGHALTSAIPNVLITGDQAFFYDRNAFWHNYTLPNLFVVILNNHGGIIFNLIDGPTGLPEAEEFFITHQKLNAKSLAQEFGFSYESGTSNDLKKFLSNKKTASLLEIETTQNESKSKFENFKKHLKNSYAT